MKPYDWALDREPFDWEGDFDPAWDFPRFPPQPDTFYDPCPLGCDLGTVYTGPLVWECPACAGTGLGGVHEC